MEQASPLHAVPSVNTRVMGRTAIVTDTDHAVGFVVRSGPAACEPLLDTLVQLLAKRVAARLLGTEDIGEDL